MLSFTLEPYQTALQEEIISFVRDNLNSTKDEEARTKPFNRERWGICGQILLQGLAIPKEYGGRGLSAVDTFLGLEALGYANPDNGLSFSISAHLLACTMPLFLYGSEKLKEQYLEGLSNGEIIAANGMTEPATGSDAFAMTSTGIPISGGYIINGSKTFVSNGPVSDAVMLYVATDLQRGFMGGITAFWIDKKLHTYTASPPFEKAGLGSSALGSLFFHDLEVAEAYRVGQEGRGAHIFNRSMEWERICLGACHLGNLQRLMEDIARLIRINRHIKASQSVMHQLANIKAQYTAVRLQALAAAWKMDQGKPVGVDAAMAKLQVSELYKSATLILANSNESLHMPNRDAALSHLDAISSTIYSGTSEMQRTIISQAL